MLLQPTIVKNVIHPLVSGAFIKHQCDGRGFDRSREVLVLDTHPLPGKKAGDVQAAILADIDLILDQVMRKAIKVDSVEIRVHH